MKARDEKKGSQENVVGRKSDTIHERKISMKGRISEIRKHRQDND